VTEVIYYVAASLDGFIATPDGGIGWLKPFEGGAEDYGYAAFYAGLDTVLLGRHTAELSLSFGRWPYPGKAAWVFTRRGMSGLPAAAVQTSDSPVHVLAELEARGLRRAWLVGGAALAASFRAASLISEYVVSVVPVLLGAGIPLFGSPGPQEELQRVGTETYASGIVQLRYRRARD
jgi:dihydrofolate reductase